MGPLGRSHEKCPLPRFQSPLLQSFDGSTVLSWALTSLFYREIHALMDFKERRRAIGSTIEIEDLVVWTAKTVYQIDAYGTTQIQPSIDRIHLDRTVGT